MKRAGSSLLLSATDIANRQACKHLTSLDVACANGELQPPGRFEPFLEILRERGFRHEKAYLDTLAAKGLRITRIDSDGDPAAEATVAAMRRGEDVIVQATLGAGRWRGRADVLLKVERPSALGEWSYEVVDTKLSVETKAGTLLQLCLYSRLVELVQEALPEYMHVVTPRGREHFRTTDYLAYFRLSQADLEGFVDAAAAEAPYPEPVSHCDICRWWLRCDKRRRQDDHLSLVADVSRLQRRELEGQGVKTLEALAQMPLPMTWKPRRGSSQTYERAREQARVQLEERTRGKPVFELLPIAPDAGLARLPEPSGGDVFFDIEGDAFVGEGGREYLFGYAIVDGGTPVYQGVWALDAKAERAMFEDFIDWLTARAEDCPDFHVYHFAPYEPAALKRLMGRYATREDELDALLRAERFVDLHAIVRQALRASVERYSIKDLEKFYGYSRDIDLREVSEALRGVEWPLELEQPEDIDDRAKQQVETYNRDDCLSTLALRDWLEALRSGQIEKGEDIPRPELEAGEPSEDLSEWLKALRDLQDALLAGLPEDPDTFSDSQRAVWVLANVLEYFRREDKAVWWEYFRLQDLPPEALLDEKAALYGLEFIESVGGTAACPVDRYRFPRQECDLRSDCELHLGEERVGTLEKLDHATRTLDIRKTSACGHRHPPAVFGHTRITARVIEDALQRLARWVRDHGIDAPGRHRAARDLLLRRPPRLPSGLSAGDVRRAGETVLDAGKRLALALDGGVLAIQGPPGTGKTYTGARMICELVRAGKKVGITAVSHKVVRNLLDECVKAAAESGLELRAIQKVKAEDRSDEPHPSIAETTKNPDIVAALAGGGASVAAGTAWLWARTDLSEHVDVLFVDEAGQMALAMVLAVAQAAKSLVLLGDPMQLEQPQQCTHPAGTAVSALEHLLGDHPTIPPELGLFLDRTWRLHPAICAFTSELFYESRLEPVAGLENQRLIGQGRFNGSGLWFVPVAHHGNQNSSVEEADVIGELVSELLRGVWVDGEDREHKPTLDDILIVAPYNAQVTQISERVPNGRAGTVDKFQGQEAPVVIYSMTTSTPEDAPRGMEFLYSLSRLNVATSRARAACILVANPLLFDPECRTPRQMQLANAVCRYREMAREVL